MCPKLLVSIALDLERSEGLLGACTGNCPWSFVILLFQENIRNKKTKDKTNNPDIGLLDRYSDGKCDNSTLVNSLFLLGDEMST